jgi:hypothetical protein
MTQYPETCARRRHGGRWTRMGHRHRPAMTLNDGQCRNGYPRHCGIAALPQVRRRFPKVIGWYQRAALQIVTSAYSGLRTTWAKAASFQPRAFAIPRNFRRVANAVCTTVLGKCPAPDGIIGSVAVTPVNSRTPTSRSRFATADPLGRVRESHPGAVRAANGTRSGRRSHPCLRGPPPHAWP